MIDTHIELFLSECKLPMFKHAYTASLAGPGVGAGGFKHGAVIVNGGTIISAGFNQYKTHPILVPQTEFPYLHAETHSMFKFGLDNISGATMYVVRIRPHKYIGLSMPCEVCQYFIKKAKISHVYYTTNEGYDIWIPTY